MHKDRAVRHLEDAKQQIQGTIWLLNKCNHGYESPQFPHHVRDRISEALVMDLNKLVDTVIYLQQEIEQGLDNEGKDDDIPF
jgi:hypothetical protein